VNPTVRVRCEHRQIGYTLFPIPCSICQYPKPNYRYPIRSNLFPIPIFRYPYSGMSDTHIPIPVYRYP